MPLTSASAYKIKQSAFTSGAPVANPRSIAATFLLATLALAVLVSGFMAAVLPVWFIVALFLMPAFLVLLFFRKEYGPLAVVALACGLIHPAFLPKLGPVHASDLALGATLFTAFLVRLNANATVARKAHIGIPYWAFQAMVAVSIIYAVSFRGVGLHASLGEARELAYLLLLPATIWLIADKAVLGRLANGLIILGLLFSVGQLLQGLLDIPIFGNAGRLEALLTLGQRDHGVTRTLTRGIGLIEFALFLLCGRYLLGQVSRLIFWPAFLLLSTGIILTFGRTTYATALLGLAVVAWMARTRKIFELAVIGLAGLMIALSFLSYLRPTFVDSLAYRVTKIGTEVAAGMSAKWRYYEAEVTLPQIADKPLLGLGLGADYRPPAPSDVVPEQTRYIHNAYIYMASKLGLPALAVFLWFMLATAARAWHSARKATGQFVPLQAAAAASLLGFFFSSITEPHFMVDYSLSTITIIGALVIAGSTPCCAPMPETPPVGVPAAQLGLSRSRTGKRSHTPAVS